MAHGTQDYYSPHDDLVDCVAELQNTVSQLGTVAGKLDTVITRLETVATKLDTVNDNLANVIADIDTSILKLVDIVTHTGYRVYAGYAKISTTCTKIVDNSSGTPHAVMIWAHPENTGDITIYDAANCDGDPLATLGPGGVYSQVDANDHMCAKAASGTQYLAVRLAR